MHTSHEVIGDLYPESRTLNSLPHSLQTVQELVGDPEKKKKKKKKKSTVSKTKVCKLHSLPLSPHSTTSMPNIQP